MIEKMAELNRVIIAIEELMDGTNVADFQGVLKQCESMVIEGRLPNHDMSIAYAEKLGFLKKQGRNLVLTEDGVAFLELNPDRVYELSDEQKRLLLRMCFLHGPLRLDTLKLLKNFSPAFGEGTFRWSQHDGQPLECEAWLVEHLTQVGLLNRHEDCLEVNPEYVNTVATFISEGKGWTEEALEVYLRERKEVGELAEQLVLEYEKKRLRNLGCKLEATCVRRISRLRVDAGYDLESFDKKMPSLNYNRFIEIKGAKDSRMRFFWTDNEIKVAKKLGERYWIYFLGGIDLKGKSAKTKPVLYQNPIESILKNAELTITPQGVIVEGKS